MRTRVITASVDASVAGQRLGVTGFTITLGVNAIPSIELQCAPSNTGNNTPLKPNVKRPRISDFSDLYRDLAVKAEGLNQPGHVYINIKDDLGHTDSINLKGWILAGAGLSSVSASAAPYLSVILQHPICKLTKFGSIYEIPKSMIHDEMNKATKDAGDFLKVVNAAYKCVREKVKFWPSPNDYPKKFREQLGVGEFAPDKYLEFSGENGIFLGGGKGKDAKGRKQRLAQAIGRLALPSNGGSSTWDMIIGASGTLLLSVTQNKSNNYTKDKLVIEPTQPWKTASISLYDEECFWTEIPGMDPFRLTGVVCRKLGPYNDDINLGLKRNGTANQKDYPGGFVMYVPPGVDTTKADGRIMMTSAPAVLDAAFRRDATYGKAISQGNTDMQKDAADNYNDVIKKYCKAVYEITAASMIHAKAQMAMWFTDMDGNLILPGNTCRFVSEGKDIYYGYIRNVVHSMSTSGGCSTTVAMSYVRPEASFKIGDKIAIEAGSRNAAYE